MSGDENWVALHSALCLITNYNQSKIKTMTQLLKRLMV